MGTLRLRRGGPLLAAYSSLRVQVDRLCRRPSLSRQQRLERRYISSAGGSCQQNSIRQGRRIPAPGGQTTSQLIAFLEWCMQADWDEMRPTRTACGYTLTASIIEGVDLSMAACTRLACVFAETLPVVALFRSEVWGPQKRSTWGRTWPAADPVPRQGPAPITLARPQPFGSPCLAIWGSIADSPTHMEQPSGCSPRRPHTYHAGHRHTRVRRTSPLLSTRSLLWSPGLPRSCHKPFSSWAFLRCPQCNGAN